MVESFYCKVLELGVMDYGVLGLCEIYVENYYVVFIWDLDGNIVEVVMFLEL